MRRTKIVCTLGPSTASEERIEALMKAGMDVARLNFSHGTHDEHAAAIALVRSVSARLGTPIAILQDLSGPKIRTGPLRDGQPVRLVDGVRVTITTRPVVGTSDTIATTYAALPSDVAAGDRILLADGAMELRVLATTDTDVECEVVHGGMLGEHKGINLPGVAVSAPALTAKDLDDLRFGVGAGVDFIALSFVRRPEDILAARTAVTEAMATLPVTKAVSSGALTAHADTQRTIPIIAKLEKPEAVTALDAILLVADGVMVARGDLGVEMPLEQVPVIQKHIIAAANAAGLPVITATQMLESMIHEPRPTRAEASDVANAILDGTDALMLSAETSIGDFPVEAVETMARVAVETEAHWELASAQRGVAPGPRANEQARAVSKAARTLATGAGARVVMVFTRSGTSAHLISKERPMSSIVAFTPSDEVYRRLALWWGVSPRRHALTGSTEHLIETFVRQLRSEGVVEVGDCLVVVGGMPAARRAATNFLKVHHVTE